MSIESAVWKLLKNGQTGIAPHPSYAANDLAIDSGDEEYITYEVTGVTPSDTKSGVSTLDEVEIEVRIFSKNHESLVNLAQDVRSDLDRTPFGTYGTIRVQSSQFIDESQDYDERTQRFMKEQNYIFRVIR